MFKTRITEILGIEYPIIQGGILWLSTARSLPQRYPMRVDLGSLRPWVAGGV